MTAAETSWLNTSKLHLLAGWAARGATTRRVRLIGCGMVRVGWPLLIWESARQAVAACEDLADGMAAEAAMNATRQHLRAIPRETVLAAADHVLNAIERLTRADLPSIHKIADQVMQAVRDKSGRERLCKIVRDISGNPFRPMAFDPGWRTETAVALARGMYDGRDFGPMPILADALEDAGCDHPDLLAHCRDRDGVHVRGCWVVDGVLGLS